MTKTPEWRIQAAVVAELLKLQDAGMPFLFAGDMAAGRRSRQQILFAKATGLVPGEPDLRVYLPTGRVGFIELKTPDGKLSKPQRHRHEQMRSLGHDVRVVRGDESDAVCSVMRLIQEWMKQIGGQ